MRHEAREIFCTTMLVLRQLKKFGNDLDPHRRTARSILTSDLLLLNLPNVDLCWSLTVFFSMRARLSMCLFITWLSFLRKLRSDYNEIFARFGSLKVAWGGNFSCSAFRAKVISVNWEVTVKRERDWPSPENRSKSLAWKGQATANRAAASCGALLML